MQLLVLKVEKKRNLHLLKAVVSVCTVQDSGFPLFTIMDFFVVSKENSKGKENKLNFSSRNVSYGKICA